MIKPFRIVVQEHDGDNPEYVVEVHIKDQIIIVEHFSTLDEAVALAKCLRLAKKISTRPAVDLAKVLGRLA